MIPMPVKTMMIELRNRYVSQFLESWQALIMYSGRRSLYHQTMSLIIADRIAIRCRDIDGLETATNDVMKS